MNTLVNQVHDSLSGPDFGDDQAVNYANLMGLYSISDSPTSADYFLVADQHGVSYYAPNDEDWGTIIAVSHSLKVACDSTFYEMSDMLDYGWNSKRSEYAFVPHEGKLIQDGDLPVSVKPAGAL
jgi:hypothetical protein